MVAGVGREVELGEDAAHVGLDGLGAEAQLARQCAVRAALSHQGEHRLLALGQRGERVVLASLGDEAGDELGIDHAVAVGHSPHVANEGGQVGDSVLEEVAHASVELGHEPHGVVGLDVLGEQEHANVRARPADLHRRVEAPRRCGWVACGC